MDRPTLVNWPAKPDQLAYNLFNVYRNYNKDELVIIPKTKLGPSRFHFLGIRILVPPVQKRDTITSTNTHDASLQGGWEPHGQGEVIAVSKIVQWWRRCSEKLKEQRERAKQRAVLLENGRHAEVLIGDIIRSAPQPRYWHHRQILKSSGVMLLGGMLELRRDVESVHQRAMGGLTDKQGKYKLSSAAVEDIQDIIGDLQRRKGYLDKTKGMFCKQEEVQTLLDLSPDRLQHKINTALEILAEYQQEVGKWSREIKDCLDGGLLH